MSGVFPKLTHPRNRERLSVLERGQELLLMYAASAERKHS